MRSGLAEAKPRGRGRRARRRELRSHEHRAQLLSEPLSLGQWGRTACGHAASSGTASQVAASRRIASPAAAPRAALESPQAAPMQHGNRPASGRPAGRPDLFVCGRPTCSWPFGLADAGRACSRKTKDGARSRSSLTFEIAPADCLLSRAALGQQADGPADGACLCCSATQTATRSRRRVHESRKHAPLNQST